MNTISTPVPPAWTLLLLSLLFVGGCAEEEFIPVYQVHVTANPDQIGDGVLSSSISITALDQEHRPAPAGYQVTIFGVNQSGEISGYIGRENESILSLSLDPSGGVQTIFSCTEQGNIMLVAQLQSLESTAVSITCL